jgi:hypothetical protein
MLGLKMSNPILIDMGYSFFCLLLSHKTKLAFRTFGCSINMAVDTKNDLLVITSASGKQTAQLLPRLYSTWKRLRLVVNSALSQQRLQRDYPHAEVVQANLAFPEDANEILKDASVLYHIGPSFHPHETEIAYNVIDAAGEQAQTGNFKHFIYSSVLNSQLRKMMNHDESLLLLFQIVYTC